MRQIGLIAVCLLAGCASDGRGWTTPGSYVMQVGDNCTISIDSTTIKGGPSVIVQRLADGACSVEIQHNAALDEIKTLIDQL